MSVQPRNELWNRLLARAEARAKEQPTRETHHYRPRSPGDDHLRASFENSLVYHGLKIETEFNLRLQRPPRKRKTKRKSDLPVAERLRNDRAVVGSPGPTHRTPTGTPARRISKTTPLSRPPIPPAPLPPLPVATRAAAARERVLNAVSDDDEPPVRNEGPVVELSESSVDGIFLARTTKPDGGAVIVLPHFDQAANSNDTSSWEEDAILVQQPPREHGSDGNATKNPGSDTRGSSDMSPVLDLGPRYTTSKRDRARRAKARKITSSDSSPEPDSDSGKNRNGKDSVDEGETTGQESGQPVKNTESRIMNMQSTSKRTEEIDTSKSGEKKTNKNDMSENGEVSKEGDDSCTLYPRDTLLGEGLLRRVSNMAGKHSDGRLPAPVPVLSLSSSSDGERSTPSRRPSPPMRAVVSRRRTPSDISVEDKLFGPLSPLSSPRRRARNISESEGCVTMSNGDSRGVKVKKRTSPRRRNDKETHVTSVCPKSNTRRQGNVVQKAPLRRSPRRSRQGHESERRSCDLEVIATGPTALKQAPREQDKNLIAPKRSGLQRKTVRKSAPRDSSSEAWEDALSLDPIDVDSPTNLPKKTRASKSPPASSLSGSGDDSKKTKGKKPNTQTEERPHPGIIRITNLPLAEDDSSDDQSRYVAVPRTRLEPILSRPLKRKRTVGPSSKTPGVMDKRNKTTSLHGKARSIESAREEKNTHSSGEVEEIRDSDSDVCIVSFSPANVKGSITNNLQKLDQCNASRKGNGKFASNFEKEEAMKSSSDDSDVSPKRRSWKEVKQRSPSSPRCKLPLRIRRRIELQSNRREDSKSPTGRGDGSRSTQAGRSLVLSESDEGSGKDTRTLRTSPRNNIIYNIKERANRKENSKSPTGRGDGSGGTRTDQVLISSDSDEGSRQAVKETVQTRSSRELPIQIPASRELRTQGEALLVMSDSDGSDSPVGLSWFAYEKTEMVSKKGESRGRGSKRNRESAKKERQGGRERGSRPRRGSSVSRAENSDSCMDVDRPLNSKDGSRESSRKRRRRK